MDQRKWYLGRSIVASSEQLYFYRMRFDPALGAPVKEILDPLKCEALAERVRLSVNILLALTTEDLIRIMEDLDANNPPDLHALLTATVDRVRARRLAKIRAKGV